MCPCGGGQLVLLGKLGRRYHYRCRACGMDSSSERANLDLVDEGGEG